MHRRSALPMWPRHAYGARSGSASLTTDFRRLAIMDAPIPATAIRAYDLPRGRGARLTGECPNCGRRTVHVYSPPDRDAWACRVCWGLHYPSQRAGRRPEASPDRLLALWRSLDRARAPQVRARRGLRFRGALETYQQRLAHYATKVRASHPALAGTFEPMRGPSQ
jgi:hypothetical protein